MRRHALFELRASSLHLRPCEVLVAIVDGFGLAAIDRHSRRCEKTHLPANLNKARTHFAQRSSIVLAEVSNGLVVGH
jgi:hypothetical protein